MKKLISLALFLPSLVFADIDVSCGFYNEGFVSDVPSLKVFQPITLSASDPHDKHTFFKTPTFTISIANGAIVTHGMQKPFISTFEIQVRYGDPMLGGIIESASASNPKRKTDDLVVAALSLRNDNGEFKVECSTLN